MLDDLLDEPDEQFTLTLNNANAPLAGGNDSMTVTGTLTDDDEPPLLSIADATLTEGAGVMGFTVRLGPPSARIVTVHYATHDQAATAGADYTSVSGTLTFAAGATTRTIGVPIVDDDQDAEDAETFTVTLSNPGQARLARAEATGFITDNDTQQRSN